MKFFKIIDGTIFFNKDEIALYPLVKKILAKDKGGKIYGDPDGRHKMYAMRELTYVYFKCDFEAYPAQHGLNEKESHEYARKQAQLEKDYQPDEAVLLFMKQYEKEHLSQTKNTIKTLIRVFALNEKIIQKIEINLTASLELQTLTGPQISELLSFQKQLIDLAVSVPATTKKLREAMSLLEEEEKVREILRGGEEKPDSMDPGSKIEDIN